MVRDSG